MQIKMTMRYHWIPVRMPIFKKQKIVSVREDMEKLEPLCTVRGNVKWCGHCEKLYGGSPKTLKTELPYGPAILLLSIYLKELKSGSWKDICTPVFIAALFIITKMWKTT